MAGLAVQAINEVIDVHGTRRFLILANRIPLEIWVALFGITALATAAVGYQTGLALSRRSPAAVVLALAFSSVIWMIADLDRPAEGWFQVSQQALSSLRESMAPPAPAAK